MRFSQASLRKTLLRETLNSKDSHLFAGGVPSSKGPFTLDSHPEIIPEMKKESEVLFEDVLDAKQLPEQEQLITLHNKTEEHI